MKYRFKFLITILSITLVSCDKSIGVADHKIAIPSSAQNIQNRGDSNTARADRGIATLLEIDQKDLGAFIKQLKIISRSKPHKKIGDPTVNGWNVWPEGGKTFVPGNAQYSGFKKAWAENPIPEEMLSCRSPVGDWLHVEVWRFSDKRVLLKLYTDWN